MLETAFDLGPHAVFIWSAYAVTAMCMIGLTVGVVASDRRQRRLLAELEARGITRRSAAKPASEAVEAKPRAKANPPGSVEANSKSQAKPAPTRRKPAAKPARTKTATKAKSAGRGSK